MDIDRTVRLIFAGFSIFTIKNKETGNHFTFKVQKPRKSQGRVWHVSYMGPYQNWLYMFTIANGNLRWSSKSRVIDGHPAAVAFIWLMNKLNLRIQFNKMILEFSDNCCRCGRRLTDIDSIQRRIGPECNKYFNYEV